MRAFRRSETEGFVGFEDVVEFEAEAKGSWRAGSMTVGRGVLDEHGVEGGDDSGLLRGDRLNRSSVKA